MGDEIFSAGEGWEILLESERFSQRYLVEGLRIWTESVARIDAEPDSIAAALRGPWDWWRKGRYENRVELDGGRIRYDLWPVGRSRMVHVRETMAPTRELPAGARRIELELEHHANGLAYFELRPRRDRSSCDLIGRFDGAEIAGALPRLMGARRFAVNHLLAERGAMSFPFPPGTGWVGLIERLESRRPKRAGEDADR